VGQEKPHKRLDVKNNPDRRRWSSLDISVIGTGHVGLVTAACLAHVGHKVWGHDSDMAKMDALLSGKMPIYEPYLEEIVHKNVEEGRLHFTKSFEEAVRAGSVIFICVGTPPKENGEADLSAVERVSRRIAEISDDYKVVVEKSTVPVETGIWIAKTLMFFKRPGARFDVVSNPEFTREGMAVFDFLHPDRIVVGLASPEEADAERIMREIYSPIIHGTFPCPIHGRDCKRSDVPFLVTDIKSAELIKHASNSFLAMKISFINAIADICDKVGADIREVARGIGLDHRIGPHFLRAGIGFGGFCFPKDLRAFIRISEKLGVKLTILEEVERINERRIDVAVGKIRDLLWILEGKQVGVLGLSFKPDTDDVRFSPALSLARRLILEGAKVKGYDPKAGAFARMEMERFLASNSLQVDSFEIVESPYMAALGSDLLVVATEWDEFLSLSWERIRGSMRRPAIFDGRNFLDGGMLRELGFEYVGMGVP
jgi:UDPglucose 6-dehydrogenase